MPAIRPLYYALFISAALHAYVLWPQTLPEQARSPALQAYLRQAERERAPASATLPARREKREKPTDKALNPALSAVREGGVEAATLALPAPDSGVDAGGLRAYRTALALDLRRSGLLRQGLNPAMHGRLEVEILLSAQGQVISLGIAQGSGDQALDQLSLRALREIAPHTVLPPVLLGQMFRVVLPLEVE